MADLKELKSVRLLNRLSDEMVEKLVPITEVVAFNAGDYIFKVGNKAEYLYSLLEGCVDLEIDMGGANPINLHGIEPYFTFGISSLVQMETKKYIISAKAIKDSKIYRWKATELEKLFESDYEMGFLFMKSIARLLQKRFTVKDALIAEFYSYMQAGR